INMYVPLDAPLVIHQRYATHGSVCVDNAHPFDVGGALLFHNGTISGTSADARTYVKDDKTGKYNTYHKEDISDTRAYARDELGPLVEAAGYDFLMEDKGVKALEARVGSGNVLVICVPEIEQPVIVNEKRGDWEGDLYYSNGYCRPGTWWEKYGNRSDDEYSYAYGYGYSSGGNAKQGTFLSKEDEEDWSEMYPDHKTAVSQEERAEEYSRRAAELAEAFNGDTDEEAKFCGVGEKSTAVVLYNGEEADVDDNNVIRFPGDEHFAGLTVHSSTSTGRDDNGYGEETDWERDLENNWDAYLDRERGNYASKKLMGE
ncbi:MAG: hypothetical protein ACREGC_03480, partial [Minisyncoccia bacterium]